MTGLIMSEIRGASNSRDTEDFLNVIDDIQKPLRLDLLEGDLVVTALSGSNALIAVETSYHTCDENKPACNPGGK